MQGDGGGDVRSSAAPVERSVSSSCIGEDEGPPPYSLPSDRSILGRPEVRRFSSLSPPFSSQCQISAVVIPLVAWGTVLAWKLPPKSLPGVLAGALDTWWQLALVWIPCLAWLLFTDPGSDRDTLSASEGATVLGDAEPAMVRCPYGCKKKAAPKTKHCHKCGKCVAGFDHHCLWLNTCIGGRNYRTWVLFVSSLLAWFAVSCVISWGSLARSLYYVDGAGLAVGHRLVVLLTGLGTFAISLWLMLLLLLHVYLGYLGMTTFEWIKSGGLDELQLSWTAAAAACRVRRFTRSASNSQTSTPRRPLRRVRRAQTCAVSGRNALPRRSTSWRESLTLSWVEVHDVCDVDDAEGAYHPERSTFLNDDEQSEDTDHIARPCTLERRLTR